MKIKPGDFGARVITTGMSFRPGQGSTATYAEEEEMPLPTSSPSRGPREAEVKARKERRAKVHKEKTSRADALRVEVSVPRSEPWGAVVFILSLRATPCSRGRSGSRPRRSTMQRRCSLALSRCTCLTSLQRCSNYLCKCPTITALAGI